MVGMRLISISDFLRWKECPYSWWAQQKLKAWAPPSASMRRGTAIHKFMEAKFKGNTFDEQALLSNVDKKDQPFTQAAIREAALWTPPFKVLAVEESMSLVLSPE